MAEIEVFVIFNINYVYYKNKVVYVVRPCFICFIEFFVNIDLKLEKLLVYVIYIKD